jgi:hypothetical protein
MKKLINIRDDVVSLSSELNNCRLLAVKFIGFSSMIGGLLIVSILAACGGSGSSTPSKYTIEGSVIGLEGSELMLANNGADVVSVNAEGSFIFSNPINSGGSYAVSTYVQPLSPPQLCSVSNGSGIVQNTNVTNVVITCERVYSVSGDVWVETSSGLTIQLNGEHDLVVSGNSFSFPAVLKEDETYDVSFLSSSFKQGCSVENSSGILKGGNVTDLVVRCRGWHTPISIGFNKSYTLSNPQIAFDKNGNAIAVWTFKDGSAYETIWTNRYTNDSGWGEPEAISDFALAAWHPQIAFDKNGNAIAVWGQLSQGREYSISLSNYTPGSGWGEPSIMPRLTRTHAQFPKVTIDDSGNALFVWSQSDSGGGADSDHYGWSIVHHVDTGWGTAALIGSGSDTGSYSGDIEIATDNNGNTIAIWDALQYGVNRYSVWVNNYSAASGWGAAKMMNNGTTDDSKDPQVALDASGNALAVWWQLGADSYNSLWVAHYLPGSGWGTPEVISEFYVRQVVGLQVDMDIEGNAIAVWGSRLGYPQGGVRAAIFSKESGWSEFLVDVIGASANPGIAFDQSGDALIVWNNSGLWSRRYTKDIGWEDSIYVSGIFSLPENHFEQVQIVFDTYGDSIAMWREENYFQHSITVSHYD